MEKNGGDHQIRDLMNIESFSQLPFIRPSPPVKGKSIRLFGKEFEGNRENLTTYENSSDNREDTMIKDSAGNNDTDIITSNNNNNRRRFECPYCCRNFHTSQALGGHQNAHKRERQQERRAHMQATTMVHGVYRSVIPLANNSYGSWNNTISNASNSCFCNICATITTHHHHHHHHQPINGSPLTALWRIPSAANTSSAFTSNSMVYHPQLRPFDQKDELKRFSSRLGCNNLSKPVMHQDQVSLDLHL